MIIFYAVKWYNWVQGCVNTLFPYHNDIRGIAMNKESLTQSRLKELLHYNPDTGYLTWSCKMFGIKKGDIAGCKSKYRTGKHYVSVRIDGKLYLSHRIIWLYMTGAFPENHIDHINGNGCDNRFINLRDVTKIENCRNVRKSICNTSGTVGVFWEENISKWRACIGIKKKSIHIGVFKNKVDAIIARKMAEYQYGFHQNHGAERPL